MVDNSSTPELTTQANPHEGYDPRFWQVGVCGDANIVTFDGEDVRGVARVSDPHTVVKAHNDCVRAIIAHERSPSKDIWDVADEAIAEAYPDFHTKGPGWWGDQRIPNFGILRAAIASQLAKAGASETSRLRASARTLQQLGYEWKGGELWKPPLGPRPKFLDEEQTAPAVDPMTTLGHSAVLQRVVIEPRRNIMDDLRSPTYKYTLALGIIQGLGFDDPLIVRGDLGYGYTYQYVEGQIPYGYTEADLARAFSSHRFSPQFIEQLYRVVVSIHELDFGIHRSRRMNMPIKGGALRNFQTVSNGYNVAVGLEDERGSRRIGPVGMFRTQDERDKWLVEHPAMNMLEYGMVTNPAYEVGKRMGIDVSGMPRYVRDNRKGVASPPIEPTLRNIGQNSVTSTPPVAKE